MERVIVLKDLNYAAVSTGNVNVIDNVENLAQGAIALFDEEGALITTSSDLANCKEFVIAENTRGVVRLHKNIKRRRIMRILSEDYLAPVLNAVEVGGTSAGTRLTIDADDVGHVGVRVADNTFSNQYATYAVNATVYKKAGMSIENTVDAIVAKLNANTVVPVTAAKIGSAGNFGITITSKTRGQVLTVSLSGLVEGNVIVTDGSASSVLPVFGKGVGEDVLKAERDASVYYGNGNYREIGDRFYKAPMETDVNVNYDSFIIQEHLDSPYLQETNLRPVYNIFTPTDGSGDVKGTLDTIFTNLLGEAFYTPDGGE